MVIVGPRHTRKNDFGFTCVRMPCVISTRPTGVDSDDEFPTHLVAARIEPDADDAELDDRSVVLPGEQDLPRIRVAFGPAVEDANVYLGAVKLFDGDSHVMVVDEEWL